ncbi:MAG TPA: riboflavin synthase [Dehalococcoidia bacterium]|nr:riboflavin synthase [Dehalococcoidia bacterium]
MFSGIVEEVGRVKSAGPRNLTINARKVLDGTQPGHSLNVNGVCLTVTALTDDSFTAEVMPETLRRTNLGQLRPGHPVNLERALSLGGRLGGHLVQGHVDGTGKIMSFTPEAEALLVRYSAPPQIMRYVVEKGFIAVDGVSLTIMDCDATSFRVSLVAFTRENTNLAAKRPGDLVNLEVDIIAKYVERLLGKPVSGITEAFLAEHGFMVK